MVRAMDEYFDDSIEQTEELDMYEGACEEDIARYVEELEEEAQKEKELEEEYSKCFDEEDKWKDLEEEDFEFDEVQGAKKKKPKLAVLNKTKLSREEMDELFIYEG